jgi:hypothetical protein
VSWTSVSRASQCPLTNLAHEMLTSSIVGAPDSDAHVADDLSSPFRESRGN